MKKYLLCCWLTAAPLLPAVAQTAPADRPAAAVQYCTLVASGTSFASLTFRLDYGQGGAQYLGISAEQARADKARLNELFSVADVLNYLGRQGWECMAVTTLLGEITRPDRTPALTAGSTLGTTHSEVQYLLRRPG
jgi:hypothetical protein